MKAIIVSILIIVVFALPATSQVHKPEMYKTVVGSFFTKVFDDKPASLKLYYDFFSRDSEDETALFYKQCDGGKYSDGCSKIFREKLSRWSSQESIFFNEVRKHKTWFGESALVLTDKNTKVVDNLAPNAIDVKVKISPKRELTFVLNNAEGENPYIIDIFMEDGISLFFKIGARDVINSYKRLAKIKAQSMLVKSCKDEKCVENFSLTAEDIFFIYPTSADGWWAVEKLDCTKGFVRRDQIQLLGEIAKSETLKSSADEIYGRFIVCK